MAGEAKGVDGLTALPPEPRFDRFSAEMKVMAEGLWVTPAEAQRLCRFSQRSTIYQAIRDGRLRASKPRFGYSRGTLICMADIIRFQDAVRLEFRSEIREMEKSLR